MRVATAILVALALALAPSPTHGAGYVTVLVPEPAGEIVSIAATAREGVILSFEAWEGGDNTNPTPDCQGGRLRLVCRLTAGPQTILSVEWRPNEPALCGREPRLRVEDAAGLVLAEDTVTTARRCAYLPGVAR